MGDINGTGAPMGGISGGHQWGTQFISDEFPRFATDMKDFEFCET